MLQRIGLAFADRAEELAFRREFPSRYLGLARIFLVLAGLLVMLFTLWDYMIDPVTAPVTARIRIGLLAPLCFVAAIVLQWEWARARFG